MKAHRTSKETPVRDLEAQKQLIAYQLWEEEGRPEGKAEAHWEQACLVVMSLVEDSKTAASPIWLKRQDAVVAPEKTPEALVEQPTVVENIGKRAASRHAA